MHWLIDLFDFYIRTKLFGVKIPLLASFKVTYRCNLKCRGCPFHLRAKEVDSQISWTQAVKVMQELKKRGCRIIVFEGGEPFMWRDGQYDLEKLVIYAKKHFMRVAVTTNGTFPLNVPAHVLWVSIDGLKKTHDKLRSESFDRIWKNLKVATHSKILVHYTLNRENWMDLEILMKILKELPAFRGMTVQLFYPYGQGEESLALSASERRAALENVIKLKERGYPVLNSINRLKAMIENTWTCHEKLLINVDPNSEITTGCYALNRGEVLCGDCGFTAVAEASGAFDLLPGSIISGWRTFVSK